MNKCRVCGYKAGFFNLTNGVCELCSHKSGENFSNNSNTIISTLKSSYKSAVASQRKSTDNIGIVLGYIFSVIGLAGLIAMIVYLSRSQKKKAVQAIASPVVLWTLFAIAVNTDNKYHWATSETLAGISLVILPAISYLIVRYFSNQIIFNEAKGEGLKEPNEWREVTSFGEISERSTNTESAVSEGASEPMTPEKRRELDAAMIKINKHFEKQFRK